VVPLSKSNAFVGQHFLMPAKGAAVFINAFNFPAWASAKKRARTAIWSSHRGKARFPHGLAGAQDG